nr:protein kinase family protein [Virgibacillus sp. LDC-1]
MNKISRKHDFLIKPGMKITGKWHNHTYVIKKKLGSGAIGTVYLCETKGSYAALKISDKSASMTTEVNVLKSLGKVQGNRLGPSLLDVDDWINPIGQKYTFYVMEYIKGEAVRPFIQQNGNEWIGVFMLQLLDDLEKLHKSGWVFGDLKLENLLITASPTRIRWIDVGGTTLIGRAIKEYTEFYDRGYWGLGSRRAEPSYDLFAFVMVILSIYYPHKFHRENPSQTTTTTTIFKKIDAIKTLTPYSICLKKAITGKYETSAQMKQAIQTVLYQAEKNHQEITNQKPFLMESVGILFVAGGYYFISLLL